MDKNKKLRVGIIGTGGIANPHLDSYLKLDNVEVVAGADLCTRKGGGILPRTRSRGHSLLFESQGNDRQ